MVKSSLFLAVKETVQEGNILPLVEAIAANLEYMSVDQVKDFVKWHLAALSQ
jgi:hypothetical protein